MIYSRKQKMFIAEEFMKFDSWYYTSVSKKDKLICDIR